MTPTAIMYTALIIAIADFAVLMWVLIRDLWRV